MLKGKFKVLAIKENIDLVPWADAIYGCDAAWWRHRLHTPVVRDFKGPKVCWSGNGLGIQDGVLQVNLAPAKQGTGLFYSEDLDFGTGRIGGGGNSGFQALNLAINWGARKIVLIGYDMHDLYGKHWYGTNRWPLANNPDSSCFNRWKPAFDRAALACEAKGIQVLNASKGSALNCFKKVSLEEAVKICTN